MREINPSDETWKHLLYVVLFLVINSLLKGVVLAAAIIQGGFLVLTRKTNPYIADFCVGLSNYSYDITRFVTFLTTTKPFPFEAWDNRDRSS